MILTLTMNPAIDRTIAVDRLAFDDRAYILSSNDSAGGRGINASVVIHSFGGKTLAVLPAGGEPAARFEKFMDHCGFPVATVPIRNDIRLNLTITDRNGLTVKLNEAGPRLDREEVANVESTVEAYLGSASWLMLCGSLPPGVPTDFYAQLITRARRKNVRTLLDSDGDALFRGIEAEPTIVTPNQQEAEHLLGTVLLTRSSAITAARRIQSMGAQSVVLSLGARGALGASGTFLWEAIPPRIEAISPIGAGDAMAAAVLWSIESGDEFPQALAWGVAAGTASAKLPGIQFATLEQARAIRGDIDLRRIES
ncbi:MAG TPA: 1-phosphofructokinase family hexose kinase [Bryobacteraceae bacterium]|nr:1-phosphofructokinase family hexose kinase [Bryobacteraceae bacterium]